MKLSAREAVIKRATVEVKSLTITAQLRGVPWDVVNYCWGGKTDARKPPATRSAEGPLRGGHDEALARQ